MMLIKALKSLVYQGFRAFFQRLIVMILLPMNNQLEPTFFPLLIINAETNPVPSIVASRRKATVKLPNCLK